MSLTSIVGFDVLAFSVFLLVLAIPGTVVGWAAGLRGWWLTTGPLVTVGIIALATSLTSVMSFHWTTWTFGSLCAGLAVLLWVARFARIPKLPWEKPENLLVVPTVKAWHCTHTAHALIWMSIVVSAVISFAVCYPSAGGLANIHQDWDASFHGAMIRIIHDLNTIDIHQTATVMDPEADGTFYYPITWHALVAQTIFSDQMSVVRAMNAAIVATGAVSALSLAGLVRVWSGNSTFAACTAFVTPWIAAFPYDLMWRGPIAPFALGIALTPALVVLTMYTLRARNLAAVVILGIAATGLIGLHPSLVFSCAAIVVGFCLHRWVSVRARTMPTDVVLCFAAAFLVLPMSYASLQGAVGTVQFVDYMSWPVFLTSESAWHSAVTGAARQSEPHWGLAGLAALGVLFGGTLLYRWIWWLVPLLAAATLFYYSAAEEDPFVATLMRPWWGDAYRMLAIAWAMMPVVLAAGMVGMAAVLGLLFRAGKRRFFRDSADAATDTSLAKHRLDSQLAVSLAVIALASTGGGYFVQNSTLTQHGWLIHNQVSVAERRAYAQVAERLPDDAVVMNDPNDGSVWLYTEYGVRTVFLQRTGGAQLPLLEPQERALFMHFEELEWNPEVQHAIRERGITHLILGTPTGQPGGRAAALNNLPEDSDWLEPAFEVWPLQVWRVTHQK